MTRGIQDCGIDPIGYKSGRDLKVGDKVSVWWKPKGAMVKALYPYTGKLGHLFPEGVQWGDFDKDPTPRAPKDRATMVVSDSERYPIMP